ncbi:hypothetical protein [Caminibacter sp.]
MGILNIEEYKKRLESGNPVKIEELENELKVLIKEMIESLNSIIKRKTKQKGSFPLKSFLLQHRR